MSRHKDVIWPLPEKHLTYEAAALAALMDIRDELKKLNRGFECSRFLQMPDTLEKIRVATNRIPAKKRNKSKNR